MKIPRAVRGTTNLHSGSTMQHIQSGGAPRRTLLSIAVTTAVLIAAQSAHAQVSITSNTAAVDLNGSNGTSISSGVTVGSLTNSGADNTSGATAGLTNAGTVTNASDSGTISAASADGIDNSGTFTNGLTVTGNITAMGGVGINNQAGGAISLNGLVIGTGGMVNGTLIGIENDGSISSIDITGQVVSPGNGLQNNADGTIGNITVNSGGMLAGTNTGGNGLDNAGSITGLINSGEVMASSTGAAVQNEAGATLGQIANEAGATIISEAGNAVVNAGTINTLQNLGTIQGMGTYGIENTGTINGFDNTASGQIVGGTDGLYNNGTIAGTGSWAGIYDAGTISGGTAGIRNDVNGHIAGVGISGTLKATGAGGIGLDNAGTISGVVNGSWNMPSGQPIILGLPNAMGLPSVEVSGSITAPGTGILNEASGSMANGVLVTGSISAGTGIDNFGTLPLIDVEAGGSVFGTSGAGIAIESGTTTQVNVFGEGVTAPYNSAAVDGTGAADAIDVRGTGNLSLYMTAGAAVGANTGSAINVGAAATATITMLADSGVSAISASGSAATINAAGNTTVTADGVTAAGGSNTISNSGTGSAIKVGATGTLALTLTGYDEASATTTAASLVNNSTTAATLDVAGSATISNDGIIRNSATGGAAITIEAGANVPTITNAGYVGGAVNNLSGNALTLVGATSYTDATDYAGLPDGIFTGSGMTQGTINNTLGNLTVGSGNVVLNDTVNLGSNTLKVASGANLVTFAPVTINGNLEVASSATLTSQIQSGGGATGTTADTGNGQLIVAGNTTFDGTSTVQVRPYTSYGFAAGQRFLIVATTGTASYNLAGITPVVTGYSGQVEALQIGNDLVIALDAGSSGSGSSGSSSGTSGTPPADPPAAPTGCGSAAINGILNYGGVSPGLLNVYNAADAVAQNGSASECQRVGQQLGPNPQNAETAFNQVYGLFDVIGARADAERLDTDHSRSVQVWGQAVGGAAQNSGEAGYSLGYGGVMFGADKLVRDDLRVGGAFAFTGGSLNGNGAADGQSLSAQSYSFLGYADWTLPRGYVSATVGVSQNEYSSSRSVVFPGVDAQASAHFHGTVEAARLEGGYPFALDHGITMTPLASLTVAGFSQSSYTESDGGAGVALNVKGASANSVRSGLGVKFDRAFETASGTVVPYVKLQWIHEFSGNPDSTTASFAADPTGSTTFVVAGQKPVSDLADLTLGATVYRAKGISLQARLDFQAGSHYTAESGMIQLRKAF